jgi:hypothetical protein
MIMTTSLVLLPSVYKSRLEPILSARYNYYINTQSIVDADKSTVHLRSIRDEYNEVLDKWNRDVRSYAVRHIY